MSQKQIRIMIPASGQGVTIEVNGVKGEGCTALTEGIQNALGKTVSDVATDDMHQRVHEQEEHVEQ